MCIIACLCNIYIFRYSILSLLSQCRWKVTWSSFWSWQTIICPRENAVMFCWLIWFILKMSFSVHEKWRMIAEIQYVQKHTWTVFCCCCCSRCIVRFSGNEMILHSVTQHDFSWVPLNCHGDLFETGLLLIGVYCFIVQENSLRIGWLPWHSSEVQNGFGPVRWAMVCWNEMWYILRKVSVY